MFESYKKNHRKVLTTALFAMGLAAAMFLVVMAFYATPIADEYDFMYNTAKYGPLGNAVRMYTTCSGRFIQSLIAGFSYSIFGDNRAQIIVPILLFAALVFSIVWLIWLLNTKFWHKKFLTCLAIGLVIAGGILYTTYCLFDLYLWLDSSVVYLMGIFFVVFDAAVCVCMATKENMKPWQKIVALTLVFMGQTAGEVSMALVLFWSGVLVASTFIFKRMSPYKKTALIFFCTVLAGSLVMILSPGLHARADKAAINSAASLSLMDLFVIAPINSYAHILSGYSFWQICIIVAVGISIGVLLFSRSTKKVLAARIMVGLLCALSCSYAAFVAYAYGNKTLTIESRATAIACFGMFIGLSVIIGAITSHVINNNKKTTLLWTCLCLCLSIAATPGFLRFNIDYVSVLSYRKNVSSARLMKIFAFQSSHENQRLIIPDIPIMIERSNAIDFTGNGYAPVDWFYDTFLAYYNLQNGDILVIGDALVNNSFRPEWYADERAALSFCVSPNTIVLEKYWCVK